MIRPTRDLWRNTGLLLIALATSVLVLEVLFRVLATPSEASYGRLMGIELPPRALNLPEDGSTVDRSQPEDGLVIDGRQITVGDLWGLIRPDDRLGYAPIEGARSENGWWESNRLGARSPLETTVEVPPGRIRILVFGDSYAAGSRLPYEETWTARLEQEDKRLEVVNFGVDGYGTGQAYLRYNMIRHQVDYDIVLLTLVPPEDLWRDINVRRDIGGQWSSLTVMPRFLEIDGQLQLVSDPFDALPQADAPPDSTREAILRNHLRAYDRFYIPALYEEPPLMGVSILVRIGAAAYGELRLRNIRGQLLNPSSEAAVVTSRIVASMREEVEREGKRFVLAILPTARAILERGPQDPAWAAFDLLAEDLCRIAGSCIRIAEGLRLDTLAALDTGYDGTHFGPSASRRMAELIAAGLEAEGLIVPVSSRHSPRRRVLGGSASAGEGKP